MNMPQSLGSFIPPAGVAGITWSMSMKSGPTIRLHVEHLYLPRSTRARASASFRIGLHRHTFRSADLI